MKIFKKAKYLTLILMVLLSVLAVGCSKDSKENVENTKNTQSQEPKEVLTLKAVTFLPANHPLAAIVPRFAEIVKEKSNGEIIINNLGGPEIIPTVQLAEAIQKGLTADIGFSASAHYQALVPEGLAMPLSKIYPWEERETGFYNEMVKYHEKANLAYLGRWMYSPFYLWSKKPVTKPEDLRGMRMRTLALSDRFMKELGVVPVTIMPADTYTALERGLAEGFAWAVLGARDEGWTDKVKYLIKHPFFDMQNTTIIMNLDKWDSLKSEQQEILAEATKQFEREMVDYFKKAIDDELKILQEKEGVKIIEFTPDEAKKFIDTAYEVEWKALAQKIPVEIVTELRKLSEKS